VKRLRGLHNPDHTMDKEKEDDEAKKQGVELQC
jgi:hypothetical protein